MNGIYKIEQYTNIVINKYIYMYTNTHKIGHVVAQLVEELRYKTEGGGFDFR